MDLIPCNESYSIQGCSVTAGQEVRLEAKKKILLLK